MLEEALQQLEEKMKLQQSNQGELGRLGDEELAKNAQKEIKDLLEKHQGKRSFEVSCTLFAKSALLEIAKGRHWKGTLPLERYSATIVDL
mmetsp:Transcript_2695/g.6316  ORF Transcript_2695/g.6316 Transcript_2695/m.6316 type:complete len:90 (-) Transcript_2695:515-784(-)